MKKSLRLDDLPARDQGDGWYLILDATPIEKYECVIEPDGLDFAEFVDHKSPGLWNHDRSQLPVATWEHKVVDGKWLGRPSFDGADMNPFAPAVEKYFRAGRLRLSAGLTVTESGTIIVGQRQLEHVIRSRPQEVTFCLYGAHPSAGKPMSLQLSEDVEAGIITQDEAEYLMPPASAEMQELAAMNANLKDEISNLREERESLQREGNRLRAELDARPKPPVVRVAVAQRDNQSGLTTRDAAAVRQCVQDCMAQSIASAVQQAMRRHLGQIE